MGIADIVSNILFLLMGVFGISVQIKEINYFLLAGSVGIIAIVITQYVDQKNKAADANTVNK
jgi:hypothetical protein